LADLDGDGYPISMSAITSIGPSPPSTPHCIGLRRQAPRHLSSGHFLLAAPVVSQQRRRHFADISKAAGLRVEHPTKDYGKGLAC